jgi:hypothetical protein
MYKYAVGALIALAAVALGSSNLRTVHISSFKPEIDSCSSSVAVYTPKSLLASGTVYFSSIMKYLASFLTVAAASLVPVLAQGSDPLQIFTISADNISASFIPYGARLTSLIVPDRDGQDTEVAVGYDDPARYILDTETNHTYFGTCCWDSRLRETELTEGRTYCGKIRKSDQK